MRVNLLLFGLVERNKAIKDIIASSGVVSTTFVVGEVVLHGADRKLLLEAVDLVQEENDGCLDEPTRVADRVEQGQSFLHTVDGLIFEKELVVFGDGDKEENGGDILEAVNPLLTFGTLTTDVEHAVSEVANDEGGLGDTGGLDTRTENILIAGEVVGLSNALDGVKVASNVRLGRCKRSRVNILFGRIVELIFAGATETLLYPGIAPKSLDGTTDFRGKAVTLDLRRLHKNGLDVVFGAGILERKFKRLHGLQNDTHRLNGIAVDDFLERFPFIARVATLVDELHLLQDGGLSRFTGTWHGLSE